MKDSSQSRDSSSGILFSSAFFSSNKSLSRAEQSMYLMWFCFRSLGLITAKNYKRLSAVRCWKLPAHFSVLLRFSPNLWLESLALTVPYWLQDVLQAAYRNGHTHRICFHISVLYAQVADKRSKFCRAYLQWCCRHLCPFYEGFSDASHFLTELAVVGHPGWAVIAVFPDNWKRAALLLKVNSHLM